MQSNLVFYSVIVVNSLLLLSSIVQWSFRSLFKKLQALHLQHRWRLCHCYSRPRWTCAVGVGGSESGPSILIVVL